MGFVFFKKIWLHVEKIPGHKRLVAENGQKDTKHTKSGSKFVAVANEDFKALN